MKHKFEYSFSRLTEFKEVAIHGPFAPMHVGETVSKVMDEQLIAVYRINIKKDDSYSEKVYQEFEGSEHGMKSYTGYDALLVVFPNWVVFVVDRGGSSANVAACFGNAADDVHVKEFTSFAEQLPKEELEKMMIQAYNHAMEYVPKFMNEHKAYMSKQIEN
jgi:hypothetical protein